MINAWTSLLKPVTLSDTHTGDGLIPLTDHTLITITGPDAIKFLQGQCTCDVSALLQGHWQLGAHCNIKGRMISSFTMALLAEDCVALRVHNSVAESTMLALQKYIVFSKAKCAISEALSLGIIDTLPHNLTSHALNAGQFKPTEAGTLLRRDDNVHELWVSTYSQRSIDTLKEILAEDSPYKGLLFSSNRWQRLMIERGIAEVQQATVDTHLPQAFNFDLVGGVNFKKGCYTGQEIIARLHYKGQSKQRLHAVSLSEPTNELITVGQRIINAQGKALGEIVAFASSTAGTVLLVSTKAFTAEAPPLFVAVAATQESTNSAVNIPAHPHALLPLSLPYAIP